MVLLIVYCVFVLFVVGVLCNVCLWFCVCVVVCLLFGLICFVAGERCLVCVVCYVLFVSVLAFCVCFCCDVL